MFVYYIDGEKFTTDDWHKIPEYDISFPDENTPAWENLETGEKLWCEKDWKFHRLTGPATIFRDKSIVFWLNDKRYENINVWLKDHPNPDLYFDALGMNETDRVLWFLQN